MYGKSSVAFAMAMVALAHRDMLFGNIESHHKLGEGCWAWDMKILAVVQHLVQNYTSL